jgi:hypothetical protein
MGLTRPSSSQEAHTLATDLSGQSTTPASNTTVSAVSIAEGTAPSNINDAMRAMIAQSKGALLAVTSAGTNTITCTFAPVPDAYVSGWLYPFKAGGTSTGAATFNANSLGAKDVKKMAGGAKTALVGGEIVTGGFYTLRYDGTDMILDASPPKVAQMVKSSISAATGTTTIPLDNTKPQNTEGDQYVTLAITPLNASSTLIIDVRMLLSNDVAANHTLIVALFQDSTADALAAVSQSCVQSGSATVSLRHEMAAGTTSATTFKVRAGCGSAGTTRVNGAGGNSFFGGVAASSITIMEILP